MESPDGLYQWYIDIWRPMLTGWLGWSEDRFTSWTAAWDYAIRNVDAQRTWFYHDHELDHVLRLLVPDELAQRLEKQRTRRMYNDLAELMYEELHTAIVGRPADKTWGSGDFDWGAAKRRVDGVLRHHGAMLPGPADESLYERRIRNAYTI